jgi:calcium permeable stress-gated cation channel
LFSCVPQQILDEAKIRKVFGDSVKNVWISRDTDELDKLVKEREQTAFRLEKAEILLIKKANAARNLAIKNGHPDIEVKGHPDIEANVESVPSAPSRKTDDGPDSEVIISQSPAETPVDQDVKSYAYVPPSDINGSVASQWLPHSERPRHRPLANYGRRVDTIKWTRSRLKILNAKINKLRRQQRLGKGKPIPAVFIEFDSQVNAQSAYQALAHHRALHMSPKFIGVRPYEIVWSSLRMRWWERIIRRFSIQAFITVMIIFWSIPCALVGIISNINFLTSKVPFLGWINDLPKPILGIITGLLPAVALSFLMAIVPAIMRSMSQFLIFLWVLLT